MLTRERFFITRIAEIKKNMIFLPRRGMVTLFWAKRSLNFEMTYVI